jgi:hypothetical protein
LCLNSTHAARRLQVCEALVRVIPEVKAEAKQKYMEAQKTGARRRCLIGCDPCRAYACLP